MREAGKEAGKRMVGLERQLSNFRISKPLKVVDFMQLFRGHRQLREPPLSPAALSRLGEAVVGTREGGGNEKGGQQVCCAMHFLHSGDISFAQI